LIPRDVSVLLPVYNNQRHYRINVGGSETTLFNVSSMTSDSQSVSHGFDIENYHRRVRMGELMPHTPYERWRYDFQVTGSYHNYNSSDGTSVHTPSWWTNDWFTDSLVKESMSAPAAVAKLKDYFPQVQAAAAKIYTQGHDSLTFVAEFTKTISMFANARESLIKLITSIPKGKTLAQSWLEFRYGWRTLYFDMVDVQHALVNLNESKNRFSERTGTKSTSSTATAMTQGTHGVSPIALTMTATREETISVRGSVAADIEPPRFRFNPAITAWELVKFSFIIDWFINVGLWLEAMSFLTFATSYSASGSVKIEAHTIGSLTTATFGPGYSGTTSFSAESHSQYMVRIPTRVPTVPLFNVRVNVPKFIDLWALLVGKGSIPNLRTR
jgi:hypothetical protein